MANTFEERFLSDPTDQAGASAYFEQIRAVARFSIENGDISSFWELTNLMKTIGKFLPIKDPRNPDFPLSPNATGQQG